jgi:uncharacterized glyoxalase superfamily protein PhnB
MKPTPAGWPRISSGLCYRDPARMIDWLCEAFAFEVQIKVVEPDGSIKHSELTYGDGLIMVSVEEYWADRSYGATDPEGHLWWFSERVRDPTQA